MRCVECGRHGAERRENRSDAWHERRLVALLDHPGRYPRQVLSLRSWPDREDATRALRRLIASCVVVWLPSGKDGRWKLWLRSSALDFNWITESLSPHVQALVNPKWSKPDDL